jgi:hypothetical protein
MILRIFVITCVFFNFAYSNKLNGNQYVLDFSFDKNTGSGSEISIEVFKSIKNDAIISARDRQNYDNLEWISIGVPQIYQLENRTLRPISLGFNMEIEILSKEDQLLIRNSISEIYNIEVDINQIKRIELDHMECTIQFEDRKDAYTLRGAVHGYDRNPLEVWFNYKSVSEEYSAIMSYLNNSNIEDLRVQCHLNSSITNLSKNLKIDILRSFSEEAESAKILNTMEGFERILTNHSEILKYIKSSLLNNTKDFEIKVENRLDIILKEMEKNSRSTTTQLNRITTTTQLNRISATTSSSKKTTKEAKKKDSTCCSWKVDNRLRLNRKVNNL